MTLDDPLEFRAVTLEAGVPLVVSSFDNMSSATLGVALRADGLAHEQLRYLSLLPALLTRVGVIENGAPVSFELMSERLRNEILGLSSYFSTNPRTGRVELVVRGAGLGADESRRAIDWMTLALHHPDWRPENLPRIRDLVDQTLSGLRNTMQGSEESWVNNPATAYRLQRNAPMLAADSFLTRTHNALRLRWLFREPLKEDREALTGYFADLAAAAADRSRAELTALLAAGAPEGLSATARGVIDEVHTDLTLTLGEIPDDSLQSDWSYLVSAIRDDLFTTPASALAALDEVRRALLHRAGARMFFVTSTAQQKALLPRVEQLAASLNEAAPARRSSSTVPHVDARVQARQPEVPVTNHLGLLAPNMSGGVITTSVAGIHFSDYQNREKQLDYLASRLHSGYGAHGVFLRTLAAGLAYSNGLRGSVQSGQFGYYAERTPEIPQTVGFVVETLRSAELDRRLGEYSVAQLFAENRAAATYESRAEGIAADLADNQPPDQVRRFRSAILELRKDPELPERLFERKDAVYSRMLPGYAKGAASDEGVYFAIGPDRQLDAWERYLIEREGADARLTRLYPRDFWMP
jgi:hypothetical protein